MLTSFLINKFLCFCATEIKFYFFVKEYKIEIKSTKQSILYSSQAIKTEIVCRNNNSYRNYYTTNKINLV